MNKHFSQIVSLTLLLLLTTILLFEAWHDAGTYDEVGHITAGYSYVYLKDFRLYPDNPPLIKMLSVLPWWPIQKQIKFPLNAPEFTQINGIDQWKLGTKFLYQSDNNADLLVFLARLPIITITILMGLLVSRIATDLYGNKAGLFALFLYTFEPNIRAHGHLATTDVGATFFALLGIYFLYKAWVLCHCEESASWRTTRQSPLLHSVKIASPRSAGLAMTVAGFFFGLALLSKYSMLFFLPIIFLIILPGLILRRLSPLFIIHYSLFILIAYATLWFVSTVIGYTKINFRYDEVPLNKSAVEQLSNRTTWKLFHLVPWPYYYQVGLETMYARNMMGQPSFLFGQVNPSGNWWHYFLITYLVKTPVPILVLFTLAFTQWIRIKNQELRIMNQGQKKPAIPNYSFPIIHNSLFIIPFFTGLLFFTIVSLNGNLSIGLRFIFPSIVLFLIFASSVISNFKATRRNLLVGSFLCVWLIATNISSLPYDLSYVNEIGGGTWNGYKTVEDSSYDWGQDLKRLRDWVKKSGMREEMTLSYLGTADPAYYGIKYKPLKFEDLNNLKGTVAISSTNLMLGGRYLKDQSGRVIYDPSPLGKFFFEEPISRAGTTIFIYRFP